MPDVTEVRLPGVGVRHEYTTAAGDRVGVLTLRGGRRELLVYDRDDPDRCSSMLHLTADDTHTLAELLGASQMTEAVASVQNIEGLAMNWVTVVPESAVVGSTIGDGQFRTRTGVSIVAVVRGTTTVPSPEPDFRFEAGDVAVAIGTPDGLAEFHRLVGT